MGENAPNIVYVFADDMGYGDMGCNNPDCRIPTPNLDRLAASGMRFTDAHAATAVCTPSRYGVLTGRYCWRSRLKRGIVWPWDGSLIEEDRATVANLLRDHGYATACIGKWHLGWDWATHDGRHPNENLPFGVQAAGYDKQRAAFGRQHIDFDAPIGGGPVDRGFDAYFGVDVPNFPPYAWFEDDRLTARPTVDKPESMYGHPGPMVEGWTLEPMIPEFTRRAVDRIERRRGADAPFFLYLPLTSPHSPIVPNEPFKGMSQAGLYGDFVCEVDWVVGQVVDALERTGQRQDTLVIFTSDNGPEKQTKDDIGCWERIRSFGHYSMGGLRGMKRDAWEGGHRVPFVASWPAATPAGTTCDQPVCLTDLMATCADILGAPLAESTGEDSVSMLPLLKGVTDRPTRDNLVYHSLSGKFALRRGKWVYIDAPAGGDNAEPDWFREARGYRPHDLPGELFDLDDDLPQRHNRFAEEPDVVAEMSALLAQIREEAGFKAISDVRDERLTE